MGPANRKMNGQDPAPTTAADAEPTYFVERILSKRMRAGKPYYWIKWQGYNSRSNSWEPLDNLYGCGPMLAEFEHNLKKKKAAKKTLAEAKKDQVRASENFSTVVLQPKKKTISGKTTLGGSGKALDTKAKPKKKVAIAKAKVATGGKSKTLVPQEEPAPAPVLNGQGQGVMEVAEGRVNVEREAPMTAENKVILTGSSFTIAWMESGRYKTVEPKTKELAITMLP